MSLRDNLLPPMVLLHQQHQLLERQVGAGRMNAGDGSRDDPS